MSSHDDKRPRRSRREALALIAGSAGAAAATALPAGVPLPAVDARRPKARAGEGYRETDHIRSYYRLARY